MEDEIIKKSPGTFSIKEIISRADKTSTSKPDFAPGKEDKHSYYQLLKDPRWQKKRLEIMQRDGFRCKKCESNNNTLHVHHKYYIYKKKPWDYPDELLVTLCEDCHQEEEDSKYIINDFAKVLLADGYFVTQLVDLLKLIRQLPIGQDGVDYIVDAAFEYYKKSDNGT